MDIMLILKDGFLILSSFAVLFLIVYCWTWLLKNLGTF